MAICPRPKRQTPHEMSLNQRPAKRGLSNEKIDMAAVYTQLNIFKWTCHGLMPLVL